MGEETTMKGNTRPVLRRGLNRVEAAQYIGIGASKFDALVIDGRMPPARQIDRRRVWDVNELDAAFDALPSAANSNSWEDAV